MGRLTRELADLLAIRDADTDADPELHALIALDAARGAYRVVDSARWLAEGEQARGVVVHADVDARGAQTLLAEIETFVTETLVVTS